ncbi:MAG: N-acetylmuramoyl-L-alanine amidase [Lachnospiraceae bacterium]|nr:N-acetylmuramoyl-L-alanine amidase [Lachnospiraceae bacterium]
MSREEEERRLRRELRRIQRKKQERIRQLLFGGLLCVSILILLASVIVLYKAVFRKKKADPKDVQVPEYVEVKLLTPNPYSRPELSLEEVNGIVVHYVANPCSTARENRNYFESLKDQTGSSPTSVSSHFVIGLEGEVVQCIPLSEVAYASNNRNSDTISIECCHPDETGRFYDSTYDSLVQLCAYLCREFDLKPEAVIRHYDVTGKICPKYYVEHEDAWEQFHKDVAQAMKDSR